MFPSNKHSWFEIEFWFGLFWFSISNIWNKQYLSSRQHGFIGKRGLWNLTNWAPIHVNPYCFYMTLASCLALLSLGTLICNMKTVLSI